MRARPLACVSLVASIALLTSACGGGTGISKGGDPARGKMLFIHGQAGKPACGSCHTLADAGTHGMVGPNLDQAFAGPRLQGFRESTIQQVVADQIVNAACVRPPTPDQKAKVPPPANAAAPLVEAGNCMPRHLVTGENVNSVALYVASVAGKPVQGGGGGGGGKITATSGKAIFTAAGCSSCHTLKAAGATATVGPNLDQLKPPTSRVVTQVTNGGAVMPAFKDKLTKQQIQAVAAYVSSNAGK